MLFDSLPSVVAFLPRSIFDVVRKCFLQTYEKKQKSKFFFNGGKQQQATYS